VLVWNNGSSSSTVTISPVAGQPTQWEAYSTGSGHNCVSAGTVAPGGTVSVPSKHLVTLYNNDAHPTSFSTPVTREARATPRVSAKTLNAGRARMVRTDGRRIGAVRWESLAPGVYFVAPRQGSGGDGSPVRAEKVMRGF
jgi:hypothetical protein